jgi:hypothetical protein
MEQIKRNRALVGRLDLPPHLGAVVDEMLITQWIASPGRHNLDNLRAEFPHCLAGEWTGNELVHFNNATPFIACREVVIPLNPVKYEKARAPSHGGPFRRHGSVWTAPA